jgi:hypothetical protein
MDGWIFAQICELFAGKGTLSDEGSVRETPPVLVTEESVIRSTDGKTGGAVGLRFD